MYPAKIILFGEYLVLNGSDLLGTPFNKYYGIWSKCDHIDDRLNLLADFIEEHTLTFVNNQDFRKDISLNLKFQSNIPQGYGCGSSGALIAALYDKYVKDKDPYKEQIRLSQLESFFHGSSSGVDPTLSLYNKTILFSNKSRSVIDKISLKNFYLFDSKIQRHADNFVTIFLEKMNDFNYSKQIEYLKHVSNKAISSLHNESDAFLEEYISISQMQLDLFDFAIPSGVDKIWRANAKNGVYFKLCGAGGGGYFLVYSEKDLSSSNFIPL